MLYKVYCDCCRTVVETYECDDIYECRSYNHKKYIPFEYKYIELPEATLYVPLCKNCINDDKSVDSYTLLKRIEWYNSNIKSCDESIKRLKDKITKHEKNIQIASEYRLKYYLLKIKLLTGKSVLKNDIPENMFPYGSF